MKVYGEDYTMPALEKSVVQTPASHYEETLVSSFFKLPWQIKAFFIGCPLMCTALVANSARVYNNIQSANNDQNEDSATDPKKASPVTAVGSVQAATPPDTAAVPEFSNRVIGEEQLKLCLDAQEIAGQGGIEANIPGARDAYNNAVTEQGTKALLEAKPETLQEWKQVATNFGCVFSN